MCTTFINAKIRRWYPFTVYQSYIKHDKLRLLRLIKFYKLHLFPYILMILEKAMIHKDLNELNGRERIPIAFLTE